MSETKRKKSVGKVVRRILLGILLVLVFLALFLLVANTVVTHAERNYVDTVTAVEYEDQLVPTLGEDGYYTFTTDDDLKVVQLTDVHIGSGILSGSKDNMALQAVARMVTAEQPDLVLVSGDIAYPFLFQSGSINNKRPLVTFATLMEHLGVYWAPVFGNHDTEIYSLYSRASMGELLESKEYPHCLFQCGPADVDGCGNYVINYKNTDGTIVQSIFGFDSHSYTDNDYFGALWKYDCVHKNQVEWYEDTLAALTAENNGEVPKSIAYFHIPPAEMKEAYDAFVANGYEDTDDVQYITGKAGEHKTVVYGSTVNDGLVDAFLASGSTQAVFFGHDHLNNFTMMYKGLQLSYAYSIDYLAYVGINKYGSQRGCMLITLEPDGSYDWSLENYYQSKYGAEQEKAGVSFDNYNDDLGFDGK